MKNAESAGGAGTSAGIPNYHLTVIFAHDAGANTEDEVETMNQTNIEIDERMKDLAEACARAGVTEEEVAAYVNEIVIPTIQYTLDLVPWIAAKVAEAARFLRDTIRKYQFPLDEFLKPYGTTKELHLMKHSKKYRTRKKYRDRLTRRMEHDQQN